MLLICRALDSILAPMSSMQFPLRSTLVRQVLLPRALIRMLVRVFSRESATEKDCRDLGKKKQDVVFWTLNALHSTSSATTPLWIYFSLILAHLPHMQFPHLLSARDGVGHMLCMQQGYSQHCFTSDTNPFTS